MSINLTLLGIPSAIFYNSHAIGSIKPSIIIDGLNERFATIFIEGSGKLYVKPWSRVHGTLPIYYLTDAEDETCGYRLETPYGTPLTYIHSSVLNNIDYSKFINKDQLEILKVISKLDIYLVLYYY